MKASLRWHALPFALLVTAMLLLSACSFSGTQKGAAYGGTEIGGFLGGDRGLVVNVIDGAPPSVIQDEGLTPFSFVLTLENVGEAKVGEGTDNPLIIARITGINPKDFGLTDATAVQRVHDPLENARRNIDGSIMPGEITHVSFENLAYKQNIQSSFAITLRGEVCYDYESYATAKFCMKQDFVESAQDASICMLRSDLPYGNSGAPLHVTNVRQAPVNQNTIQINFDIEHFGNGIFFSRGDVRDDYEACRFDDMNPSIYKLEVLVEPVQKDTYDVECLRLDEQISGGGAKGVVRTSMGAPLSMTCFLKRLHPTEVRVYEDLVKFTLKYRYGEFLEVPILVQGHP